MLMGARFVRFAFPEVTTTFYPVPTAHCVKTVNIKMAWSKLHALTVLEVSTPIPKPRRSVAPIAELEPTRTARVQMPVFLVKPVHLATRWGRSCALCALRADIMSESETLSAMIVRKASTRVLLDNPFVITVILEAMHLSQQASSAYLAVLAKVKHKQDRAPVTTVMWASSRAMQVR